MGTCAIWVRLKEQGDPDGLYLFIAAPTSSTSPKGPVPLTLPPPTSPPPNSRHRYMSKPAWVHLDLNSEFTCALEVQKFAMETTTIMRRYLTFTLGVYAFPIKDNFSLRSHVLWLFWYKLLEYHVMVIYTSFLMCLRSHRLLCFVGSSGV